MYKFISGWNISLCRAKSQAGVTTTDATIIGAMSLAMDAFTSLTMFQMKEQLEPNVRALRIQVPWINCTWKDHPYVTGEVNPNVGMLDL